MNIKNTIATINQMEADGVIQRYAIGGAVGATFYLEPVATLDVDVFVTFQPDGGNLIVSPQHIFDYLKAQGGMMDGEYVVVDGWPVQFLPAADPLVLEALDQAVERNVADTPARVFTAEHLAAIALQTGRAKDKARLLQFIEAGVLDPERFQGVILRHNLTEAWRRFEQQFLGDNG
ncbi:MAG TPA: hypothetical protein PKA41_02000 [Verrucomicrobiota bacterium]|nr:hypothetical protein [Verrucomicrobiota bacterium]